MKGSHTAHRLPYAPWLLLGALFILSLFALWPGAMSPDAMQQYKAAVSGVYSDHHPPAMSLLWRYLDQVYPGPGLLFTFHLCMLYAAAAIFIYIFRNSKFKWWYAIYPLIPNMLAYTSLIVKDTSFTYAFLLAGAILSSMMVNKTKNYKLLLLALVLILLFYGSAVKFQAKYLLIFFTIGIAYCLVGYRLNSKAICGGIILAIAILFGVLGLNALLVPKAQEAHTWQFVKLYDLTAISIDLNQPLYPPFITRQPGFDFFKIKHAFNRQEIDSLVFQSTLLQAGNTEQERKQLWDYWFATVYHHPWLYFKNRFRLWSYNLTSTPSERSSPVQFLAKTALRPIVTQPVIAELINEGYKAINGLFRFIWLLPLLIIYTYLGARRFIYSLYATPLLMFSLTSLALLGILFFFSMAATARYVFLCTCLVHASHGFAYKTWRREG